MKTPAVTQMEETGGIPGKAAMLRTECQPCLEMTLHIISVGVPSLYNSGASCS